MPTYEFRCPEGHDFEKFYRSIGGAESQATCPQCGKLAERRMSATGFAFKGSGFYLTDYGKNAHRKSGGDNAPAASTDASSSSAASSTEKKSTEGGSGGASGSASSSSESKPAPAPGKPSTGE
jgi:putative FmdB family regulatory protein